MYFSLSILLRLHSSAFVVCGSSVLVDVLKSPKSHRLTWRESAEPEGELEQLTHLVDYEAVLKG